jgi:hypothetical protein
VRGALSPIMIAALPFMLNFGFLPLAALGLLLLPRQSRTGTLFHLGFPFSLVRLLAWMHISFFRASNADQDRHSCRRLPRLLSRAPCRIDNETPDPIRYGPVLALRRLLDERMQGAINRDANLVFVHRHARKGSPRNVAAQRTGRSTALSSAAGLTRTRVWMLCE